MKFCLSDRLFRYVLRRVEKFPEATFTEAELRKISSDGFDYLLKEKLLKYKQSDPDKETFPCPTPCDKGCDRAIGKIVQGYQAICPEYSSVKPISLTKSDLNRYIFDVSRLVSIIKKKNQLVGSTYSINERISFVGEKSVGEKRVGVFLAFLRNKREADSLLLGLSNQIPTYERTLVLLPLFDKTPQRLSASLERQNIMVARFEEAFLESDLVIDFARLERRRKPKVGVEYPPKTSKQQRDYEKYLYLCKDRLFITGKVPKKRSNLIRVNDKEIRVPDSEMLLLLCLVMELKKVKGGWVTTAELYKQEITEEDIPHRLIDRLRKRLALGLLERNGEKFIENDGRGGYRISTHPDFVVVEKRNWLVKKYNELKEAIRKERERRELRRKRREEAEVKRALLKQK